MKNRVLDHSNDWATPPHIKEKIHKEFDLKFDPCPWHHDLNEWDGLKIKWEQNAFVNPGYSLRVKTDFVKKGLYESQFVRVVFLIPVSTSTNLFHKIIKPNIKQDIRFWEGRIPFIGINSKGQKVNHHFIQETTKETILYKGREIPLYVKNQGQHDSMLIVFDGRK